MKPGVSARPAGLRPAEARGYGPDGKDEQPGVASSSRSSEQGWAPVPLSSEFALVGKGRNRSARSPLGARDFGAQPLRERGRPGARRPHAAGWLPPLEQLRAASDQGERHACGLTGGAGDLSGIRRSGLVVEQRRIAMRGGFDGGGELVRRAWVTDETANSLASRSLSPLLRFCQAEPTAEFVRCADGAPVRRYRGRHRSARRGGRGVDGRAGAVRKRGAVPRG
jgi:hypothetical protein